MLAFALSRPKQQPQASSYHESRERFAPGQWIPRRVGVCPYGGQPRGPAFQEAGEEEMVGHKTAHLEGRDKAARQQQRRMLGPLRNLTVQPATRERYDRALEKFRQFLKEESRQFSRDPGTLDLWLSQYIEVRWEGGEGRALAADTIAAVQDYLPAVKGKLAASWRLMKTYENMGYQ